jgi:hypothetical protein
MDIAPAYFKARKKKAKQIYNARRIHNPYLDCEVVLNLDGVSPAPMTKGGRQPA